MHVVHVETGRHLYGGAQQVLYLVRGLQSQGISNTLVCMPGSDLARDASSAGVRVSELPCRGDLDLLFAHRLKELLGELQPTLVHAHSRRGADLFTGWAAGRIPAVLSRRVDSVENELLAGIRYRRYRRIIAISQNVFASLMASGVDPQRIVTIRSAVDIAALTQKTPRTQWLHDMQVDDGDTTIAMVAQFIARKGHDTALQLLDALRRDHPRVRLLLFGKGPLEQSLRDRVAAANLQPFVRFAGFRRDLDGLLGHADMLLHPAIREGLGVAMLKAAGAGVPVVAFDVAGSTEAVSDGVTGLLAPPGDTVALLAGLTRLVENPALRAELGAAGQRRMRDEFSLSEMIDRHLRLYDAVLNDP